MMVDADSFVFVPPPQLASARRVLIKPNAGYPLPHPVTTSRETLAAVVSGIRRVSDADIILLEESRCAEPVHKIYRGLGYDFPRVSLLDVRSQHYVEVENPLTKPLALPTIWVPNVILACDYLISVASYKVFPDGGSFTLKNLVGLLPSGKYGGRDTSHKDMLHQLGIHNVITDIYFTIPFDCGIVDARKKFIGTDEPTEGIVEEYGKVFVGEPYEVDCEASAAAGITTRYLALIEEAKGQFSAKSLT
ncbi:MAG TPA: DUF362 domain-containing protein [Dehalococcoidia bacterium]|nr:DUF362 domain-containing protein [Dehalococcoidia bacterium]